MEEMRGRKMEIFRGRAIERESRFQKRGRG